MFNHLEEAPHTYAGGKCAPFSCCCFRQETPAALGFLWQIFRSAFGENLPEPILPTRLHASEGAASRWRSAFCRTDSREAVQLLQRPTRCVVAANAASAALRRGLPVR